MTGGGVRIDFGRFPRVPIALACAGFSAFVLALCVLAGAHFKRGVEQDCYRETENIAQILMASFDDDATTADAILRMLAAEIPENDVSETHETELHGLLTRYALQPSMIGPAILDRDGTLIASALVDPVPKISLKDRNIFRSHAETPGESKLYISSPIRGVVSNEWAIQFSGAMRDKSGAQFHPECVEALIRAIHKRGEVHGAGHEEQSEFTNAPEAGLGSAGLGDLLPSET